MLMFNWLAHVQSALGREQWRIALEIRCLDIQWDMYIAHTEGYLMIWAETRFEGLSIQKLICYPLFPLYENGLPFLCETPH